MRKLENKLKVILDVGFALVILSTMGLTLYLLGRLVGLY